MGKMLGQDSAGDNKVQDKKYKRQETEMIMNKFQTDW